MKHISQKNTKSQEEFPLLLEKIFFELSNDIAELLVANEMKYKNNKDIYPYITNINNQLSQSCDYILMNQILQLRGT